MPIYAYRCEICGHQQDFLQKVSDPHLTDCPACGKAGLKRQLTAAGFQLKGSGWYVTDFRNNGTKPASQSDKGSNTSADTKSDANADRKSEPQTSSSSDTKAPTSGAAAASAPSSSASSNAAAN